MCDGTCALAILGAFIFGGLFGATVIAWVQMAKGTGGRPG